MPNVAAHLARKISMPSGENLARIPAAEQEIVESLINQWIAGDVALLPKPSPFVELAPRFETECRNQEPFEAVRATMDSHVGSRKYLTK